MDGDRRRKKIGIVTIFNVLNYGAVLQGFSLYKTIESLGFETRMLNYVPNSMRSKTVQRCVNTKLSLKENVKNFIKRELLGIGRGKEKAFNKFIHDNETVTRPCKAIDNTFLNEEYEAVIVGSDQVWNPEYTDGSIDENFMLMNVAGIKKLSFSSSLGSKELSQENKALLKYSLSSFVSLSVRETFAQEMLIRIGLSDVHKTCDPTFLLGKSQWEEVINKSGTNASLPKRYLLIYTFDHDERCFQAARTIARKLNLQILSISSKIIKPKGVMKQYSSLSPSSFLQLFAQSSFVVTNSFHGTCFSLIFEKNFIAINKTNNPARIYDLLSGFDLLDRLCYVPDEIDLDKLTIDYKSVSKVKEKVRQEALNYLRKNLC